MLQPYTLRALGNGARTDHPIPELPFVDDTHIPVEDPDAIEAVGRNPGEGMWGRTDPQGAGWLAFTTDPIRHDLAWCVRFHPEHGRSVVLYRDEDASQMHMTWWNPALLFRAGGYWWDGAGWNRPAQVWDWSTEDYLTSPVPGAVKISAADRLAAGGDPARAQRRYVNDITIDDDAAPTGGSWLDDLALWASTRPADARPLTDCVITVTAPELTPDQLVGAAELARMAGIAPATLRAYIARGEGDLPLPQATISGRNLWSRPVAEDWVDRRRRSADAVADAVRGHDRSRMSHGASEVREVFAGRFFSVLWGRPDWRKRWALRWRTQPAVQDVADLLGATVAAGIDDIVPVRDLITTIELAVLDELMTGHELDRRISTNDDADPDNDATYYGINPAVAGMLDWLIRHHPDTAQAAIGEIIGEAKRRRKIPPAVTQTSIRTAIGMHSKLPLDVRLDFFDRVFISTIGDHH